MKIRPLNPGKQKRISVARKRFCLTVEGQQPGQELNSLKESFALFLWFPEHSLPEND